MNESGPKPILHGDFLRHLKARRKKRQKKRKRPGGVRRKPVKCEFCCNCGGCGGRLLAE